MDVRQLIPLGRESPLTTADLAALYAVPAPRPGRPAWLRLNFVTTLDGSIQGPDGRSGTINNPTDTTVFALQRALADVILVGAGTARVEGYGPATVREDLQPFRVQAAPPPIAVVTATADVGDDLLADPDCLLLTNQEVADAVADRPIRTMVCGESEVDMEQAVRCLANLGYRHIVCEGGGMLAGELVAAGQVDELCLTFAPWLRGGDTQRLLGEQDLPAMTHAAAASLIADDDGYLLGRWLL